MDAYQCSFPCHCSSCAFICSFIHGFEVILPKRLIRLVCRLIAGLSREAVDDQLGADEPIGVDQRMAQLLRHSIYGGRSISQLGQDYEDYHRRPRRILRPR